MRILSARQRRMAAYHSQYRQTLSLRRLLEGQPPGNTRLGLIESSPLAMRFNEVRIELELCVANSGRCSPQREFR